MGVRPGYRRVTDNLVHDMKQYFIIKKPKEVWKTLEIDMTDVHQLEREYQAI